MPWLFGMPDSIRVPAVFELDGEPDMKANIDLSPEVVDGVAVITKLVVSVDLAEAPAGVTAWMLRDLASQWDELVPLVMVKGTPVGAAFAYSVGNAAQREVILDRIKSDRARADPIARREMNIDHLEKVAAVYREAVAKGRTRLDAIRKAFPGKDGRPVSKSTAARWVAEARKLRLLDEDPMVEAYRAAMKEATP